VRRHLLRTVLAHGLTYGTASQLRGARVEWSGA
jgi:hypothetical protein